MLEVKLAKVLTNSEAARYVRVSTSFLNKRRCSGGGPRFVRMGRRVGYLIDDLDHWLQEQRRRSTSDNGTDGPAQPHR
jgi:hypothetical protein